MSSVASAYVFDAMTLPLASRIDIVRLRLAFFVAAWNEMETSPEETPLRSEIEGVVAVPLADVAVPNRMEDGAFRRPVVPVHPALVAMFATNAPFSMIWAVDAQLVELLADPENGSKKISRFSIVPLTVNATLVE